MDFEQLNAAEVVRVTNDVRGMGRTAPSRAVSHRLPRVGGPFPTRFMGFIHRGFRPIAYARSVSRHALVQAVLTADDEPDILEGIEQNLA